MINSSNHQDRLELLHTMWADRRSELMFLRAGAVIARSQMLGGPGSASGRSRVLIAGGFAAVLALALSHRPAAAATATSTFTVSATVQATCSIAAGNLAFGTYTGVLINNTATLSVSCTNTTPYNIGLNAGTSTGATVTTRKMTGTGANTVAYGLYRDAGHATNWGNTVGTDTLPGTGNGAVQAVTIYGQMAAGQLVTPGAYSDTITATINY
jgi:spore coat protein U-like protein